MSDLPTAFWVVAGVVLAYPVLCSVVLRMAEDTRLELADTGRALLQSPKVTEEQKYLITDMLADVFDWKFMAMASIALPMSILTSSYTRDFSEKEKQFLYRDDVKKFYRLHFRSVMAASPFFTVIFFIVAAILFLFVIAFIGWSMINLLWADTVKHATPSAGSNISLKATD
ncbi:MAG: hypothetical protein P1V21_01095 [Rhizobiaceae bacterium]|nr:hypothetical protein [Rhizobiaceae bacterium]